MTFSNPEFLKENRKTKIALFVIIASFVMFGGSIAIDLLVAEVPGTLYFNAGHLITLVLGSLGILSGANVVQKIGTRNIYVEEQRRNHKQPPSGEAIGD